MSNRCKVKVETGSSNLIVAFSSAANWRSRGKFEWKNSLVDNTRMSINSDFLFLKDCSRHWYLTGARGLGKDLNETIYLLKKECETYENVIFMGSSAGGYASILFGSLLGVDTVLAILPQTDLKFAYPSMPRKSRMGPDHNGLFRFPAFNKYWNLRGMINQNVKYYMTCEPDDTDRLHAFHHYQNLSDFSNVHRLYPKDAEEFLKSGELEKFLVSHLI